MLTGGSTGTLDVTKAQRLRVPLRSHMLVVSAHKEMEADQGLIRILPYYDLIANEAAGVPIPWTVEI